MQYQTIQRALHVFCNLKKEKMGVGRAGRCELGIEGIIQFKKRGWEAGSGGGNQESKVLYNLDKKNTHKKQGNGGRVGVNQELKVLYN